MGYVDTFDVTTMLSAVEIVLHHLAYPLEWAAGVRAAQDVLATSIQSHLAEDPQVIHNGTGGDIVDAHSGQ